MAAFLAAKRSKQWFDEETFRGVGGGSEAWSAVPPERYAEAFFGRQASCLV